MDRNSEFSFPHRKAMGCAVLAAWAGLLLFVVGCVVLALTSVSNPDDLPEELQRAHLIWIVGEVAANDGLRYGTRFVTPSQQYLEIHLGVVDVGNSVADAHNVDGVRIRFDGEAVEVDHLWDETQGREVPVSPKPVKAGTSFNASDAGSVVLRIPRRFFPAVTQADLHRKFPLYVAATVTGYDFLPGGGEPASATSLLSQLYDVAPVTAEEARSYSSALKQTGMGVFIAFFGVLLFFGSLGVRRLSRLTNAGRQSPRTSPLNAVSKSTCGICDAALTTTDDYFDYPCPTHGRICRRCLVQKTDNPGAQGRSYYSYYCARCHQKVGTGMGRDD